MPERCEACDTEVAVGERPLKPLKNPRRTGFLLGKMCKKPNKTSGKVGVAAVVVARRWHCWPSDFMPFWHIGMSESMPSGV